MQVIVVFFIGVTMGVGEGVGVVMTVGVGLGVGVGVTLGATYLTLIVGAEKVKPLATKFTQPFEVVTEEVETFCSPSWPMTETVAFALLKLFPQ